MEHPHRLSNLRFGRAVWACLALLAVLLALLQCTAGQSLGTLQKVDDHPLYVMHYWGDYSTSAATAPVTPGPGWACSLFAALGNAEGLLYGRNFDWEPIPALLLYTHPPDGYASISMVNLRFLGFSQEEARDLLALSQAARERLRQAPLLPIDGMNEAGLVVGMAAVPKGTDQTDAARPPIGSLGIIREMLDHAQTVDEALALMKQYTIRFAGGPPIHYLIADATGRAVLVEYGTAKLHAMPNDHPWQVATNFLVESAEGDLGSVCWRYRTLAQGLEASLGRLSVAEAMGLLEAVSQEGTQWSAVYEINGLALHVTMARHYGTVHTFQLDSSARVE